MKNNTNASAIDTATAATQLQDALATLLANKDAMAAAIAENPELRQTFAKAQGLVAEEESVRNVAVKLGLGDDVHLVDLHDWMDVKKGSTRYLGTAFDISNMRGAIRVIVSDKRIEKDPKIVDRVKEWSVRASLLALELGL